MDKIESAEEFLLEYQNKYPRLKVETSTKEDMNMFYSSAQGAQVTIDLMIEFAKLHVKAALEQAANNAQLRQGYDYYDSFDDPAGEVIIAEDTILEAYPLENIK